jgi:hypothetical protein
MSDTENTNQSVNDAKKVASNVVATVMELKQSNPKVFFGGIAGVVVLILLVMNLGGDNGVLPDKPMKDLVIGQNYVLKNANSFDTNGKVRLVSVPGSIEAFDDTAEEDPKEASCKHLPQDTQVKALSFQDFAGKKNAFVNVEILSGPCKGRKNWALAIDVQ